jgi:hypothetical protein
MDPYGAGKTTILPSLRRHSTLDKPTCPHSPEFVKGMLFPMPKKPDLGYSEAVDAQDEDLDHGTSGTGAALRLANRTSALYR